MFFQVNLGYSSARRPGRGPLFKCGGSLVGSRYVLTAAHCVTELPAGFQLSVVRVGEHDLDNEVGGEEDTHFTQLTHLGQIRQLTHLGQMRQLTHLGQWAWAD